MMKHPFRLKKTFFFSFFVLLCSMSFALSNGYELWLNYDKISDDTVLKTYQNQLQSVFVEEGGATMQAIRKELEMGLGGLLDLEIRFESLPSSGNQLVVSKYGSLPKDFKEDINIDNLNSEGYIIKHIEKSGKDYLIITGKEEIGLLYGTFHFLRALKMHQSLDAMDAEESPKVDIRMLNHWDNLDRTIERGYSGFSIWNWQTLPDYIDQRYIDYARANASIGINGTALTNVNANALILTPQYLEKVKALADVFRPYGLKVYLTARFSAPLEIGGLETADPLDPKVIQWWKEKTTEIYKSIPDFGGFLVKANSEGQPGPQNYGRTHLDGAKVLANALAPHNGTVIWRAFVYSEHDADDRAKQAYSEFVPDDGKYPDNVLIQVKNGPIDFQPREPFHPMFGAMPNTPLMMEFQITKEYLGFATHLVYHLNVESVHIHQLFSHLLITMQHQCSSKCDFGGGLHLQVHAGALGW